ncbi:MAG: DUF4248 domain-containing protein [Bacteroidaceae bacterium]|nr:DUF4248 domain-containing protein [Bacteroidaceae bacterium]
MRFAKKFCTCCEISKQLCIARSTAVRRFRDEIHNTPELLEELKRLGYDERKRYFPPGQMAVIIKYLGEL